MTDVHARPVQGIEHVDEIAVALRADDGERVAIAVDGIDMGEGFNGGDRVIRQIGGIHDDGLASVGHRCELRRRAERQMPATVHDEDPVADLLDLLYVMARVHHRGALRVQTFDAFQNCIAALRIHRHRWLVEENQLGLVRYAAGDVEAAQQSSRQFLGAEPAVILQPHEFNGFVHELRAAGAVRHIQRTEVINVFLHVQRIEHRHVLRHHADAPTQLVGTGRHALAEDRDVPRFEGEQAEHAADRRRLA